MADALVTLNQKLYGVNIANVMGFSNVQETATWLQDFADAIRVEYVNELVSFMVSGWSLENITIAIIDGGNISYTVDQAFTLGPVGGGHAAEGMPSTNALVVSLQRLGSKPNRGRTFFAGFTEDAQSAGYWNGASQDACKDLLNHFKNGVGPAGSEAFLRIIGRPSANGGVYVSNAIDSVVPRTICATQRRRRITL